MDEDFAFVNTKSFAYKDFLLISLDFLETSDTAGSYLYCLYNLSWA